jgi:biofilm PGA synthesis N-glycosyltransferase PgaC
LSQTVVVLMTLLLWFSLAVLVYTYVGYPACLAMLARRASKPVAKQTFQPSIAVVIVGYNEAHRLAAKLDSCLAQVYPKDRLRILVVSDGSNDNTPDIVARYTGRRVDLLPFAQRRGKSACLNDAVASCGEDFIVLTDARQRLDPQAIGRLMSNLADASVGACSGELMFENPDATSFSQGVDAYWRYEKFIRQHESLTGSVVGVTGALYAIRKACYTPIPPQTILDDVAIPMAAAMRGWRIVFEKGALAFDRPSTESSQERIRKVRTLSGNFQLISLYPALLRPGQNPLLWRFVSHKVLRLLAPLAMLVAFATNLVLALTAPWYAALLVSQLLFYGMPLLAVVAPGLKALLPVKIASAFIQMNWFVVLGFVQFMRGQESHLWQASNSKA